MPFISLESVLPEVARNETRSLQQFEKAREVRAYWFFELYCDEPGCDCRRVMIHVVSDERGASQPRATLSWGWEPDDFYRKWAGFPLSEEDMEELRGPGLVRLAYQSEEAEELLEQFREMARDKKYANRIKRHYEEFRAHVEANPPQHPSGNRAERRAARRKKPVKALKYRPKRK